MHVYVYGTKQLDNSSVSLEYFKINILTGLVQPTLVQHVRYVYVSCVFQSRCVGHCACLIVIHHSHLLRYYPGLVSSHSVPSVSCRLTELVIDVSS